MNSYEVTVVLPTDGKDKQSLTAYKEILERVDKEVKAAGGTIEKTEEWGKRELAYAIKKHGGPLGGYREGVYNYFEVMLEPDKVGGINRFLETSEGVLRHLVVRTNTKSKTKRENAETKKVVKKGNGNKKSK